MRTDKLVMQWGTYLVSGMVLGIILVLGLEDPYLLAYISELATLEPSGVSVQFGVSSFMGYFPFVMVIWLLGFLARFRWLQFVIVLYRGMGLGFATWFLVDNYALRGVLYAVVLYVPQSVVILCTYFFLIKSGVKYGEKKVKLEYVLELGLASSMVFMISMYEMFILPRVIVFLL